MVHVSLHRTRSAMLVFSGIVLLCILAVQPAFSQNSWVQKVSGGGLGNPFCVNPKNDNIIYSATAGNALRISRDRGITWSVLSTISQGTAIKAVAVSARDTNIILVAMEASSVDKIFRTTNNGATWTQTLGQEFYYWGIPLAYLPQRDDDTVYTMGGSTIYRSTNFGSTWDSVRYNPFGTSSNKGWEYCIIRSDSPSVILVADNASGIWKSYDYGVNWKHVYTASGEVPALTCSKDDPKTIYATKWGGGGGFVKSLDGGETWNSIALFNNINMWGVAASTKNPNYIITGTYGPSYTTTGGIYISRDAGTTWQRTYQGLVATTNYGCLVLDTLNLFVLQGDGIFRYDYPTSPVGTLTLSSPDGGEIWHANSSHSITWTSTSVSSVKLEYSVNNGTSWSTIIASTPAASGAYSWTVPDSISDQYLVRVSDVSNSSLNDQSNAAFTVDRVFINLLSPLGGEEWESNSTQIISWNSAGVLNVRIQYSTNNGVDWNTIVSSMHASVGSYSWKIPQAPSAFCKVKVIDIAEPAVFAMSSLRFTIVDAAQFLARVMLFDNSGNNDTLRFGEKTSATDGLDTLFGEIELSIKPPPGTFDARWNIAGTNGTKLDLRDTLSDAHPTITYTLELQPGSAGYPITLHWNSETFPPHYFTIRDAQSEGGLFSIDMLAESTCVISNPAIASIQIVHSLFMTVPIQVKSKWNIVSVPLKTDDLSKATLFPSAISSAFEYSKKYHPTDNLSYGKGYWLKFNDEQSLIFTGTRRTIDSMDVSTGWNIVGSLSKPVSTATITSDPPGIIESPFYSFDNGYSVVATLEPGHGYWVKVGQSGKVIVTTTTSTKTKRSGTYHK